MLDASSSASTTHCSTRSVCVKMFCLFLKNICVFIKNILSQAPLHLHRFYSHNSSFVHGGLENNEPVFGQQEIHQKIMTLNFRDCHAKIRQVT